MSGPPRKEINGKAPTVEAKSKREQTTASVVRGKNPSLKDFPKAVRRLLKNDILLLRTASSVLHILPVAGLYTFLPKYLESQFRMAAHVANMISGSVSSSRATSRLDITNRDEEVLMFGNLLGTGIGGILVMGIGIFFSGVFIRIKKPSPKFVAAWIALTALLYAIGNETFIFLFNCVMLV